MPSTSFDGMATLANESPSTSPPFHCRRKSWARKVERICCQTISYFPLSFIYGLTTWAIWAEAKVSFFGSGGWSAYLRAFLGVLLYALANVSYTIAVFTSAGSPVDPRHDASLRQKGSGYQGLPTYEDEEDDEQALHGMSMVTAKSDGKARYCKKCRVIKPDRTHHCSSCGKCVLKMDHHCPWLATCVGLRNYKPFLLFLIYTSLFCWLCFGVSAVWVWSEIVDDSQMQEGWRVVNTILLAVLGGIIGLVLSGFTGWHIYLAVSGQTTIESLEKTRYLSPLKKSLEHQPANRHYVGQDGHDERSLGDQFKEIHANALPGVLRAEEGEERSNNASPLPHARWQPSDSPARDSLQGSHASLEAQREQERYDSYLDELDSERLPNAFDLGWKRNLQHVFGDQPLYWFLPVCNTSGDGWQWEVSPKWNEARADVARQRAQRHDQESRWNSQPPSFEPPARRNDLRWTPGQGFVDRARHVAPPVMDGSAYGRRSPQRQIDMQMQPLDRRKDDAGVDNYDTSSDEESSRRNRPPTGRINGEIEGTASNWNDIPEDFLDARANGNGRSRSRGRRKGD